jgi:hypothetical protein
MDSTDDQVRKINPIVKDAKQIMTSVVTKWVKMYNLRKAQYLASHRYISSTESYLQNDMRTKRNPAVPSVGLILYLAKKSY